MKRCRAARDFEEAADFPGRFPLHRPFETLQLPWRQRDTINHTIGRKPPACMCVKVHGHELEDVPVLLYGVPEWCAPLVSGKRDCCNRPARIMNRHDETAPDAEPRRFIKKPLLRL
ncbi:MAG TPA: hypothetical protein VHE81_09425 [Lacipirellulaceae bacterium]|nr:hypothetical protein [Lacipirellulaceae bacterium]